MNNKSIATSSCVLSRPFSGFIFICTSIFLVEFCDFWSKCIIWIRVSQEWWNWLQHFRDGIYWRPLVLQDENADWSIGIDVWMIDLAWEIDLRRLKWVVSREVDFQEKHSALIWGIIWPYDGCLPLVDVRLIDWSSGTSCRRIFTEVLEFFVDSFDSWSHCVKLINNYD